jgi:hypothetical protein
MTRVKKSSGGGAPSLDILAAKVKIVEAELTLEPQEVNLDNGTSFVAEPNLNCRFEVVQNIVNPGADEGVNFYDRFKLKQDRDGDWVVSKYSKLGNLISVRYGAEWFDDADAELDENDFEGLEFVAQIEPKTDPKGKPLTGSVLNWKSMRPAGGAEEREAKAQSAQAEAEDEDFDSIPF